VRHSDDDAREARYLHRTWRKSDGDFYVGIDPPEGAKAEGIVRSSIDVCKIVTKKLSTTRGQQRLEDVQCITDVSLESCDVNAEP
jgi:hypothetical protein